MAGRVDCIAEYNGVPSIIDFKTSRSERSDDWNLDYYIQTSAYAEMFEERTGTPIEQIVILVVTEDGQVQEFIKKKHEYLPLLVETIEQFVSEWENENEENSDGVLLLLSFSAYAQDPELPQSKPQMPTTYWAQKPVQCSNMETLIEMTKKYGEVPTIIMDDSNWFSKWSYYTIQVCNFTKP